MSKIDWNNPEEKKAYFRRMEKEYRKTHPRINLVFTLDEYQTALSSCAKYDLPKKKMARHVKQMALEAIKMGLGEQVERPPQLPEETVNELLYLLHNCSNNINQIAYNLNSRALEHNVRPVAGESESYQILDKLFALLQDTHDQIKSLTPTS